MTGVGQITAVVGVVVYCDVTTQLRYNFVNTNLRKSHRKRIRISWLISKVKKVYGNPSLDNLREKTGSLIPKEGEVEDWKDAYFYITCKTFTYLSLALLPPITIVGEFHFIKRLFKFGNLVLFIISPIRFRLHV